MRPSNGAREDRSMGFTVKLHVHGTVVLVQHGEEVHALVPEFEKRVQLKEKYLAAYIRFPEGSLISRREPWDTRNGLQHIVLSGELLRIEGAEETSLDADFRHE